MRLTSIIFLLLITISSRGADTLRTITVSYTGPAGKEIYLSATDRYLSDAPPSILSAKQSRKVFQTDALLLLVCQYAGAFIPVLAQPGDHIFLKVSADGQLSISGRDDKRTGELRFFQEAGYSLGPIAGYQGKDNIRPPITGFEEQDRIFFQKYGSHLPKPARSLTEREAVIRKNYEERIAFLDNYALSHELSGAFLNYSKNYFLYLSMYYRYLPFANPGLDTTVITAEELRQLDEGGRYFTCDECTVAPIYNAAALKYIQYQTRWKKNDPEARYQAAEKQLQGATRDFVQFAILKNGLHVAPAAVKPLVKQFLASSTQPLLSENIRQAYALYDDAVPVGGNELLLVDKAGNRNAWTKILAAKKGSLVYVDFWASWCMPCREEMPASGKLQQYFDGKAVSFLYVSMDRDNAAWISASKEYADLMKDDNYILLHNFKSILATQYKITTIPRYMLFDKNGKLITANAGRPSEMSLKTLIEKHLD